MHKLELKHLAPYLPYGLNVKLKFMPDSNIPWYYEDKEIFTLEGMMLDWWSSDGHRDITKITPLLIPLSDLTKAELKQQGFHSHIDFLTHEKRIPIGEMGQYSWRDGAPYEMVAYLFSKHYDVFGLIDAGLALNKLTTLSHA